MKVLAINGSHRKGKNTATMLKLVLHELEQGCYNFAKTWIFRMNWPNQLGMTSVLDRDLDFGAQLISRRSANKVVGEFSIMNISMDRGDNRLDLKPALRALSPKDKQAEPS